MNVCATYPSPTTEFTLRGRLVASKRTIEISFLVELFAAAPIFLKLIQPAREKAPRKTVTSSRCEQTNADMAPFSH
jgi:hypothetical protein